MMMVPPSPGDAILSAPQAARTEQATPLSMTKRTRAKAAMKISVPRVRALGTLLNIHPRTRKGIAPRPR
jgi:hypothetical protein